MQLEKNEFKRKNCCLSCKPFDRQNKDIMKHLIFWTEIVIEQPYISHRSPQYFKELYEEIKLEEN